MHISPVIFNNFKTSRNRVDPMEIGSIRELARRASLLQKEGLNSLKLE